MKKILTICIAALFMLCSIICVGAEEAPVTATDGYISINCTVNAGKGTPVLITVIPAVRTADSAKEDITETEIAKIDTHSELAAFLTDAAYKADYIISVVAGDNGKVVHNCKTENLPTDKCYVVLSYLNSAGERVAEIGGSFDNVGEADINALLLKFNTGNAGNYKTYISDDNNTEADGKKILEKSGAKMSLYKSFGEDVEDFTSLLYSLKGNTDFTLTRLVNAFNEACAYKSLWTNADTLSILDLYNRDLSKPEKVWYWELELSGESDFASLSPEEKEKALKMVKDAKYTKKTDLANGFNDATALSLFRLVETREDLTALIAEDGKYASYFAEARGVIANADLDELGLSTLYTNVLTLNAACESKSGIKTIFENSIPTSGGNDGGADDVTPSTPVTNTGGYKGGSGGSGGGKAGTTPPVSSGKTPFKDVEANHWASGYIEKLYIDGAINGVSSEAFAPSSTVARQDFVKILIGALKMELSESPSVFSDAPSGAYYEKYIMTAYEKGLINGLSDGVFGAGVNITRQDAAVIMARILDMNNVKSGAGTSFNDAATVSDYAKDAVAKVSANKIFGGDDKNNFNPASPLTRAEACAIICRLSDVVKGV